MNNNIFELEKEIFLHTYKRIPLDITHGSGVYLIDRNGNKYLDLFSGLAVNALGYAHPLIIKAVSEQVSKFGHLSNSYITEVQTKFTSSLLKYSGMDKAFLTNSGTETIEAAIKLIRKAKGPDKKIVSFTNAFHGRTYGALTLTQRQKYREGFEPLLSNIICLPFNDTTELIRNVDENTAGIFIELIQGEGGINEASKDFIAELLKLREKFNFIFVSDEIQTGCGRTGFPFAYNIYNFLPDLVVTAKAIGGGLPLGALLTTEKYADVFSQGTHGTTFGGNPICCAAGIIVLNEVFNNGIMEQVRDSGQYFKQQLEVLKVEFPKDIAEVRGLGYMLGVELFYNGDDIVSRLREQKILVNVTNLNVIRILPPLILTMEHIDYFIEEFRKVLNNGH